MKMNKKAIENAIKNNKSKVDGFVVSPDDAEHIKVIREVKQELDKRIRGKKSLTIVFIEWRPKEKQKMEGIDIQAILEKEIDKQIGLKNLINESDLDQSSKQWVLERTYNEYNRIHQLIELENY